MPALHRLNRRRDRSQNQRGAVLVEFALIATVLSTLVLGVFEIGMAWSDHQTVTGSSRSGARIVSQLGTSPNADNEALRAVEAGFGGVSGTIERVVVFEADADGDMPPGCVSATPGYSGSGDCNVYGASAFANINNASWWGSGGSCGTADANWCSIYDRDNAQATATYVGVLVEYRRTYLTGFFGGGSHLISETTVMRIEPGA